KRKCKCRVQGGKVQGAGGRMPDARCQVQQGRCPPIQILGKRNSDEHPFARSASPGQATGGGWKWVSECHGFRRPVEGSEGQVPAAVRIQAFCFSVWSPLVGQLTWFNIVFEIGLRGRRRWALLDRC
ncbi:hypothetical protein FOC1_g10008705, partial [Fusarium oxysporum f. sp. cubense race 1]